MSISMKQLTKALNKVAAPTPPQPAAAKKQKAKRKVKRASMAGPSTSVPGTVPMRTMTNNLPAQWPFAHREYLGQFILTSDGKLSGSYSLMPTSLPWFNNVCKSFEKYQWTRLSFEYIPDVGTTENGSLCLGVDWGNQDQKAGIDLNGHPTLVGTKVYNRELVVSMSPALVTPLWKPAKLTLPTALLQSRRWYEIKNADAITDILDFGPGTLAYVANGAANLVIGDLWVSYRVILAGTRKV